jgi:Fic family protein
MTYEPRFSYTNEIARDLMDIEGARRVVDVLPLPPDAAFLLRYEAQRNATHYSTSIEGNSLTLEQVPRGVAEADRTGNEQQQEVRNYWRALEWLEQQVESGAPVTEDFVRRLHRIIIIRGRGRRGEKSDYRTEECPVVDRATGQIDYGPPRPDDVPELMTALIAWRGSAEAAALPAPIRAGILAYQFVTIHPFGDGNGRTTRALATAELWLSGYRMRGFLSLEEHYYRDLQRYYDNLQMGLDPDYYLGRNDPDLTPWLSYFVETMAAAARSLSERALALRESAHPPQAPWEQLDRRSQQLLSRVMLASRDKPDLAPVTIRDVETWFIVAPRTARSWLKRWYEEGVLEPATGTTRVTAWRLTTSFATIVNAAIAAMGGTE